MAILSLAFLLSVVVGCSTAPRSYHPGHPIDPTQVSHDRFDEVLRAHVKDGLVTYEAIRTDRRFHEYLAQLDHVDPAGLPTVGDRIAFWINAYNAFAMKGIVDRYSPMTLWGRYRYFIAREYRVGGKAINLYDLERRILIPFSEPRIHFAIVCASLSCPKLQAWAYRSDRLEEQLEQVTRAFVNDSSRNRFDRERRIAYLSKIFEWFGDDFAAQSGSVQGFVGRYIDDPQLAKEVAAAPYTVKYLEYDWSLNGVPPGMDDNADSSS
ncbi:DUF547 domain-containing protein [Nitrospira sp. Nam80]